MTGCWAFRCTNRSEAGIGFHAFPKEIKRRKEWAKRVNRPDPASYPRHPKPLQPSNAARLCEKHFEESCYELSKTGKRQLKKTAVPTIFGNKKAKSGNISAREKRYVRRKAMVSDPPHVHPGQAEHSTSPQQLVEPSPLLQQQVSEVGDHGVSDLSSPSTTSQSQQIVSLNKKIARLEKELKQVNGEKLAFEKKVASYEKSLKELFNPDQLDALSRRSTQGMTWSMPTIEKALQLRMYCGNTGYNEILKQGQPLPSLSTLQKRTKTPLSVQNFLARC